MCFNLPNSYQCPGWLGTARHPAPHQSEAPRQPLPDSPSHEAERLPRCVASGRQCSGARGARLAEQPSAGLCPARRATEAAF